MHNKRTLLEYLDVIDSPNREACVELVSEYRKIFITAPGSQVKHQSWSGGYVDHLEETMWIAENDYEWMNAARPLPFTLSDVNLVLFFHDIEKPFKYCGNIKGLTSPHEKWEFLMGMIKGSLVNLTPDHVNALQYIHGEGDDYDPRVLIQGPLAAFCHNCDNKSARIWFDYPQQPARSRSWPGGMITIRV